MIPIINKKYRYVFYYNPKSACTTWIKFYTELHEEEFQESDRKEFFRRDVENVFEDRSKYYAYVIVKNPYSRIVSAYLDKCFELSFLLGDGKGNLVGRFEKSSYNRYIHDPIFKFLNREVDFSVGYSFKEFLLYLEEFILSDVIERRHSVNIHFKVQNKKRIQVDSFYRIEDPIEKFYLIYENIFKDNKEMLDRAVTLIEKYSKIKLNSTEKREKFTIYDPSVNLADYNFADFEKLKDQGYFFNYDSFYNEETRDLVNRIYDSDFKSYGYLKINSMES